MFIDSFFDTFEKRSHFVYLVFIITSIIFSLLEIIVGLNLLTINTYDEILDLVNQSYLQCSFFGRNSLFLLNIQVFEITEFIYNLLYNIQFHEKIYFIGMILCLFTRNKKIGIINIITLISIFIFIIIIFLNAINSTSVYHLVSYIHIIGYGLIFIYLILMVIHIIQFIKTFNGYLEALKVEVIIEEGN